eukprot:tig00020911_g15734.t1
MGKKKAFIDKRKAQHFQVVHRSQRDPEAANPDASQYVLKHVASGKTPVVGPGQDADAKHAAWRELFDDEDLEGEVNEDDLEMYMRPRLPPSKQAAAGGKGAAQGDEEDEEEDEEDEEDEEEEEGDDDGRFADADEEEEEDEGGEEAPKASAARAGPSKLKRLLPKAGGASKITVPVDEFGEPIDGEYDYMQHMRPMGTGGGIYYDARSGVKPGGAPPALASLPAAALPSAREERVGLLNRAARSGPLLGLDPEVAAALDGEAVTDDEGSDALDDDFVAKAMAEGAPDDEDGADEGYDGGRPRGGRRPGDSDDEFDEEEDDEFDEEGEEGGARGPRRGPGAHGHKHGQQQHRGAASMASSYAKWGEARLIDDQFDRALEEEWGDEQVGELEGEEIAGPAGVEEFEAVFDEFLEQQREQGRGGLLEAIYGEGEAPRRRTASRSVPGGPAEEVLDEARRAELRLREMTLDGEAPGGGARPAGAVEAEKRKTLELARRLLEREDAGPAADEEVRAVDEPADAKWDAETILTTYTNTENLPTVIAPPPRPIRISKKSGLPFEYVPPRGAKAAGAGGPETVPEGDEEGAASASGSGSEGGEGGEGEEKKVNKGEPRKKGETPEERKARKAAVKEARKAGRERKKQLKEAYQGEKLFRQHVAAAQHQHPSARVHF